MHTVVAILIIIACHLVVVTLAETRLPGLRLRHIARTHIAGNSSTAPEAFWQ